MKILILFFSGTGNTEFIARYIRDALDDDLPADCDLALASIEQITPDELRTVDLLVLGFPIYSLDMPRNVKEFISGIPVREKGGAGAIVFCTMGLASGNANRHALLMLESKGFHPLGGFSIQMPGSDGLVMSGERSWYVKKARKRNYQSIKAADAAVHRVKEVISHLAKGKEVLSLDRRVKRSIVGYMFGWIMKIAYDLLEGSMKKKFQVNDDCIHCGICVKGCPVGNISEIDGKITFGTDCILCLRCINQCPESAINIGGLTAGKARWKGPLGDFHPLKYRGARSSA